MVKSETLGCITVVAVTIFCILASYVHAIVSVPPSRFPDYCEAIYVRWGPPGVGKGGADKVSQWASYRCEAKRSTFDEKYPELWPSY